MKEHKLNELIENLKQARPNMQDNIATAVGRALHRVGRNRTYQPGGRKGGSDTRPYPRLSLY